MDMVVKKLISRHTIGALCCEYLLNIHKVQPVALNVGYTANDLVGSRVGAKSQRIEVTGSGEVAPGVFATLQCSQAAAKTKPQICILRIYPCRFPISRHGAFDVAARFIGNPELKKMIPLLLLRLRDIRAVHRGKRGAVL